MDLWGGFALVTLYTSSCMQVPEDEDPDFVETMKMIGIDVTQSIESIHDITDVPQYASKAPPQPTLTSKLTEALQHDNFTTSLTIRKGKTSGAEQTERKQDKKKQKKKKQGHAGSTFFKTKRKVRFAKGDNPDANLFAHGPTAKPIQNVHLRRIINICDVFALSFFWLLFFFLFFPCSLSLSHTLCLSLSLSLSIYIYIYMLGAPGG